MSIKQFGDVDWSDDRLREFAAYWDSLRTSDELPRQSDFNPADVTHLLPGMAIYELQPDGQLHCRLMGTGLADAFGWDYTNLDFLSLWTDVEREQVRQHFIQMLKNGMGLYTDLIGYTESGVKVTGSSICLPALDNEGQANRIIGMTVAPERMGQFGTREDKVVTIHATRACHITF
ncbi:PAS domain-containing protein [Sneathiella limimaris]|uniref:PAS domain-containing protein n=1 Tax=Sneathiella limimaris TaxID=1964213 RepID=UPI00146F02D0|nr:PAS domain-containing protein [Sneathiella limimaris]